MGVDVRDLSPSAQKQVYDKLFAAREGKDTTKKKVAQNGSKYGNKKVEINGIVFDSKREARRWLELDALAKAGEIQDLERQVPFLLIPSQSVDGEVVERAVSYVADFTYKQNGKTVVEDSKGHKTKDYILKRKMMLFFYGVQIREV